MPSAKIKPKKWIQWLIELYGKQAEVQPVETHPLSLCQFEFYGCVFNFLFTNKNRYAFSYELIKEHPQSTQTILKQYFYMHRQTIYICICTVEEIYQTIIMSVPFMQKCATLSNVYYL